MNSIYSPNRGTQTDDDFLNMNHLRDGLFNGRWGWDGTSFHFITFFLPLQHLYLEKILAKNIPRRRRETSHKLLFFLGKVGLKTDIITLLLLLLLFALLLALACLLPLSRVLYYDPDAAAAALIASSMSSCKWCLWRKMFRCRSGSSCRSFRLPILHMFTDLGLTITSSDIIPVNHPN